jgi:hypothetical protein
MKKQDVAAWRVKAEAEIKAEVLRLQHNLVKEDDIHAATKQRRSVAQLQTILMEKRMYQSDNKHE